MAYDKPLAMEGDWVVCCAKEGNNKLLAEESDWYTTLDATCGLMRWWGRQPCPCHGCCIGSAPLAVMMGFLYHFGGNHLPHPLQPIFGACASIQTTHWQCQAVDYEVHCTHACLC
jgi:hypothetical protein